MAYSIPDEPQRLTNKELISLMELRVIFAEIRITQRRVTTLYNDFADLKTKK